MTLILEKDVPFSLEKEVIDSTTKEITTKTLTEIQIGCGWDLPARGQGVDIDLILSTNNKDEVCYYNNLTLFEGAVRHSGDNRTGAGNGVDESIYVNLSKLPENVTSLEVAMSSFNGFNFQEIQNEFIQVVDSSTQEVLAKSKDNLGGSGKTLILAHLTKKDGVWAITATSKVTAQDAREYLTSKMS